MSAIPRGREWRGRKMVSVGAADARKKIAGVRSWGRPHYNADVESFEIPAASKGVR